MAEFQFDRKKALDGLPANTVIEACLDYDHVTDLVLAVKTAEGDWWVPSWSPTKCSTSVLFERLSQNSTGEPFDIHVLATALTLKGAR